MKALGKQVGWFCLSCQAVRPMDNQLCRCLNGMEKPNDIDLYQANYWYPVYVGAREPKVRAHG